MLVELSIKNFAIIDKLTIPFEKGLTVLTGETGAGKSIIIDAIGLLVGGRGSTEFVRYGTKRAEIEGLFSIHPGHLSIEKAEEFGIDSDDDMIILRRDITANGKSVCRINGKMVTLSILREIGQTLVDIHGQHEHQVLMQPERHLELLDSMAKQELIQPFARYQELYSKYLSLSKQVKKMTENDQELTHRLDLLQYQLKEIEKAKLEPNEDERLAEEKYRLANSEKLYHLLQDAYNGLYGDSKGLDWLTKTQAYMEEAASIDPQLEGLHETISNCFYLLEEATYSLRDRKDQVEFDPIRLDVIESRLNELNQLKRKYGSTVEEILAYAENIAEEKDGLLHKDDRIQELEVKLSKTLEQLKWASEQLTMIRKKAATELIEAVHHELKALYMDKTRFAVSWKEHETKESRFFEHGVDQVEFLLSTNPGEPVKPLAKVASGGEISRIMLAMKTIFSSSQGITSLIFDEVDTGVSGRVAQAIAEKILQISSNSQVFCITHLPQVAAMADQHLYIAKKEDKERTFTTVHPLSNEKRVEEIGRMISGVEMTELTREHAKELIEQAQKIKSNS
ncbi:DNA repair protein RecN [Alkalihalobacillus sp. LMS39]|uniref:DNA repair protein RecN n=1 Tax=Alkalihalobacillus sp. LMS39 TaxID=2924032 RepID=UPI001FB31F62|nr:DNA repair protein RecN [Alkalihalobacillus sp. LMS39]UOE95934.1 DNA repair protein RecN [Alkalihalobacillus sp. LMS39]